MSISQTTDDVLVRSVRTVMSLSLRLMSSVDDALDGAHERARELADRLPAPRRELDEL